MCHGICKYLIFFFLLFTDCTAVKYPVDAKYSAAFVQDNSNDALPFPLLDTLSRSGSSCS